MEMDKKIPLPIAIAILAVGIGGIVIAGMFLLPQKQAQDQLSFSKDNGSPTINPPAGSSKETATTEPAKPSIPPDKAAITIVNRGSYDLDIRLGGAMSVEEVVKPGDQVCVVLKKGYYFLQCMSYKSSGLLVTSITRDDVKGLCTFSL